MAQNYKAGLIITGDASGGIRAIKATEDELGKLNQGFDRGSRQSKRFGNDAARAGQQLTEIDKGAGVATRGIETLRRAAAPIAGIIAGMFAANTIQGQVDFGASLADINTRLGASTEALSQYNYVAKISGVEFGQLTTAWQRQTRRIAEAAAGTGVASAALAQLNLNAKELSQLAPEDQFERIAAAMQSVESSSERVRLAQKLWDSEGVKLVQVVNQGTDAIAAMRAEADALGLTISSETAAAMGAYNAEMDRLKFAAQGVSQTLAAELVPSMTAGLQATSAFIQEVGGAEAILNTGRDAAALFAAIMAGRYAAAFAASAKEVATKTAATVANTQAEVAATTAARAKAAETLRLATAEQAAAKRAYENSRAIAAATGNTTLRTRAITQMAAANQRAIAAEAAHTAAVNANAAAMGRSTIAAQAMAGATKASAGALALVGGPGGAAIVAVGALYYFREELGFVDAAAQNATRALDDNSDAIRDGTAAALDATYDNLINSLEAVSLQAQEAMAQLTELEARQAFYENSHQGMADSVAGAVDQQTEALAALWERQVQLQTAIRKNREAREASTKAERDGARALEDIVVTAEAASKSTAKAAKETTTLANAYENLLDRIQPNRRAARQYAQDVGVLNLALATGRMNTVQYMQAMGRLQESFQAAQRETERTAKASEDASQRIANSFMSWETVADNTLRSLDDAGRDTWLGLIDGSTSALDTVERAFQQTLANIAHMLTTQQLTFHAAGFLGLDTSGMPGGQQAGGMQSMFNNMNPGMLQKGWETASGWFSGGSSAPSLGVQGGVSNTAIQSANQVAAGGSSGWAGGSMQNYQGMGAVYNMGASMAGGYVGGEVGSSVTGKTANSNYGETAGSLIGSYWGPWGAAAGSAIGSFVDSLFGSNKKTFDFDFVQGAQPGIFGDRTSALGDFGIAKFSDFKLGEQQDALQELMDSIAVFDNSLANAAIDERVDAMRASIEGFTHSGPENLFDARLRAIVDGSGALLEDAIAGMADPEKMADAFMSVLNIERVMQSLNAQMQSDITGHLEANTGDITGTVGSLGQAIDATLLLGNSVERLNLQFDTTATGAIHSAWALQNAAGGLDALANMQSSYYQAYFSETERATVAFSDVYSALRTVTDEVPENIAGYRRLVEGLDLNTQAGQETYAQLLQLAPAFAQVAGSVKDVITSVYEEILGRTPDAAGLQYYLDLVESGGLTVSQALDEIRGSSEAAEYAANGAATGISNMADALRAQEQLGRQLLQAQGNTDALRQLEIDRLGELENAEVDNLIATQRRIWAIEDEKVAQQEAERAQQERIRAIEQEASAMARAREQLASFGVGIDNWLANLNGTDAGMGTPADQLAATSSAFEEQYAKAQTGDRDALGSITQYADRFIEAQKGWSASGTQTTATIDRVTGMLEALPERLSAEQFLADEFKGIIGEQTLSLADVFGNGLSSAADVLSLNFDQIDGNLNGLLTFDEIKRALGDKATDAQLRALMQGMDLNSNGVISKLESVVVAKMPNDARLTSVLQTQMADLRTKTLTAAQVRSALSPIASDAEIDRLIKQVDTNGDGMISAEENTAVRIGGLAAGIAGSLEPMFNAIDFDANGLIDYDEFGRQFRGMATDEELKRIFNKLDKDGNGQISKLEAISANTSTINQAKYDGLKVSLGRNHNPSGLIDMAYNWGTKWGQMGAPAFNGAGGGALDYEHENKAPSSGSSGSGSSGGNTPRSFWDRVADASMSATNREWMEHFKADNRIAEAQRLVKDAGIRVPAYATGAWNIERDHLALIHAGESVVPSRGGIADEFRSYAAGDYQAELLAELGKLQPPSGPLPMPNIPLPQFPALGNNDVLQVLNDVKRELQESRKENKRLQEENNRLAAAAVAVQQAGFNGQISEQKKSNLALDDMSAAARLEGSR